MRPLFVAILFGMQARARRKQALGASGANSMPTRRTQLPLGTTLDAWAMRNRCARRARAGLGRSRYESFFDPGFRAGALIPQCKLSTNLPSAIAHIRATKLDFDRDKIVPVQKYEP